MKRISELQRTGWTAALLAFLVENFSHRKGEVMKRANTKSDGQTKREKMDLQRLSQVYSLAGPEELPGASAILIQFFRDKPKYLQHQEGRKIMRQAANGVRGSNWEKHVFSEPLSMEDKRNIREFRKGLDEFEDGERKAGRGWFEDMDGKYIWHPDIGLSDEEFERRKIVSIDFMKTKKLLPPGGGPGAA